MATPLEPLDEKELREFLKGRTVMESVKDLAHSIASHFGISKKLEPLDLDKFVSIATELLDKHFPKGKCKERGQALVLIALLRVELSNFGSTPINLELLEALKTAHDMLLYARDYLKNHMNRKPENDLDKVMHGIEIAEQAISNAEKYGVDKKLDVNIVDLEKVILEFYYNQQLGSTIGVRSLAIELHNLIKERMKNG